MTQRILRISCAVLAALSFSANLSAMPLKVYILAGQSNMEGHAKIETFDYLATDPRTAPLLEEMRGEDGRPTVADRVWISYLTGSLAKGTNGEGTGKLTAGFGSRRNPQDDGGKIGPEFTFGLTMQKEYDGPILIIKTAWGGTSLNTDFRPPSAGDYKFTEAQLEDLRKRGQDVEQAKAEKKTATGRYYHLMIDHVKKVLADPGRIVPDYNAKDGYEIAGFVWFQGFNDMVDRHTYPNRDEPGGYDLYSQLMADFIRDVRKDLATPKLPFVIGVIGTGGIKDKEKDKPNYFRQAMAAPASFPEFQGTVAAVETAPFWDTTLEEINREKEVVKKAAYFIRKNEIHHVIKDPIAAGIIKKYQAEDGSMSKQQVSAFLEEYAIKRIGVDRLAVWERGGSNAEYHYLGAAKILAPIGKAFAEAMIGLEKNRNNTD